MWFLTWLFMSVANASPAGPALGGITLGSSLPSGFTKAIGEDGEYTSNVWLKRGAIGGISGIYQVDTCRGLVYEISFFSSGTNPRMDHSVWSDVLTEKGFKIKETGLYSAFGHSGQTPITYNYCWEKTNYPDVCYTRWTNGTREITLYRSDEGRAGLFETYDKTCTEGI